MKEIPDNKYDEVFDILDIRRRMNNTVAMYDMVNNTAGRNIYGQEVAQLRTILWPRIDESDRRFFKLWSEEYAYLTQPNDRLRMLFHANQVLQEIIVQDGTRSYEAFENETGGILSDYIKKELTDGRGFSLLIKAPPRSSKSWSGIRIAGNVSGTNFEIGTPEKPKDVLYTDFMFHQRRAERRESGTLPFSTEMIDEGIEVMDAMRGVWDESIQSMIKIMKTGFFENWLLIVVTPDESDIAKRVRTSFNAVLEPYYDERDLKIGDVRRNKNWNANTGYSSWKFHANDARIKVVGLGKITKINIKKPDAKTIELYETLSKHFKTKIQERESVNSVKREMKTHREDVVQMKAEEFLNDPEKLSKVTGSMGYPTGDLVDDFSKLGISASRKIAYRMKKILKAKEVKDDSVDKTGKA